MAAGGDLSFGVTDYVVFILILLVPVAMGFVSRFTRGQLKSTSEYLMGDRKMAVIPVAISLAVSYVSAVYILGQSAEFYFFGITYIFSFTGSIIGMVAVMIFIVPVFHPLQLTSINQYLMYRYKSKVIVKFAWFVNAVMILLFNGIYLVAPATLVGLAMGLSQPLCTVIMGVAATTYTSIGGFRTVIWTDVFQAVIITFGVLWILIRGCFLAGGYGNIWEVYKESGRATIETSTSLYERQTVWGVMLGSTVIYTTIYGGSEAAVQRMCSIPSQAKAQLMIFLTVPLQYLVGIMAILCGVVAFGYYELKGCDPYKAGYITNMNQILPYFAMDILPYPGAAGLFLSGIACASLSNISSTISGLTACTWMDLIAGNFSSLKEERKTLITKFISVVVGILSICSGLFVGMLGGTFLQITISLISATMSALFTLYFVSCLVPRLNWKSCLTGCLAGIAITTWMLVGSLLYNQMHYHILPTNINNCSYINVTDGSHGVNYSDRMMYNESMSLVSYGALGQSSSTSAAPSEIVEGLQGKFMWLYNISYHWFMPIGVGFSVLISVLSSYILPGFKETENDLKTLSPFVWRFAISSKSRNNIPQQTASLL